MICRSSPFAVEPMLLTFTVRKSSSANCIDGVISRFVAPVVSVMSVAIVDPPVFLTILTSTTLSAAVPKRATTLLIVSGKGAYHLSVPVIVCSSPG